MSIKDLFNSKTLTKISKTISTTDVRETVESDKYILAKERKFDEFVPPIDFASASNFAKFGSAELYYEKAFERIYQYYPYDGTLHEKVEFENSSSYLDKYVFENLYPRTNGYVTFDGTQYISTFGGPHTASSGMEGKTLDSTFDYSMKYDEEKKRTSAFEFRGQDGITIEFWYKPTNLTNNCMICHVSGTGELYVEQYQDDIKLYLETGSISYNPSFTGSLDTDWNHYAITLISSSAGLTSKFYKNTQLVGSDTVSVNIPSLLPTTGGLNMRIGQKFDGTLGLSGSLDEFRFWKTARTNEQIFNHWFIPVGGGTNKHDYNLDLGCYYKFNEGITGTSSVDLNILDYSGRINNGVVSGDITSFRNTGSAITEKLGEIEWKDPIIYSFHPDVVSTKEEYKTYGATADLENTSLLINYLPSWMREEDEQSGNNLKYLCQIMASYLDTLWHQISYLNKIKDKEYAEGDAKTFPYAQKLLESEGFYLPDLLSDASLIERYRTKDDNQIFTKDIEEVKNDIYKSIYNNINLIYKTKGSEKSFRNFFNSIGIGQDVVKLNLYADNSTYVVRNNYEYKTVEKRYLDFSGEYNHSASLYSTSSEGYYYLAGDTTYPGSFSVEADIILPNKANSNDINYAPSSFLTSSIFGFHSTGSTGYQFPVTDYSASVLVVKEKYDSELRPFEKQRVKFILTGSFGEVESEFFDNQYSGNRWVLCLRVKNDLYPIGDSNNVSVSDYTIELYGVESEANSKANSFILTSSVNQNVYQADKIFYAGASRQNYSGSVIHYSDIKLGHLRYWQSYVSNDSVDIHSFDPKSYGIDRPFENDLIDTYSVEIPREKTLALDWSFSTLYSSDSSGELNIIDHSSGSVKSSYGPLSDIIQRHRPAKAIGFPTSSSDAVSVENIYSAAVRRPDDLMSSDLITIKDDESKNFFVDDDVSDNFYSFEKSMYASISDEMMNLFTAVSDFNNLYSQPNMKYHTNYNKLNFMRDRFFEDVQEDPDLEKFTSFYKWIDESIAIALQQLIPAGTRSSNKINNIVESHVLERSKYVHKIPIVTDYENTEGSIKGITEMRYNWKEGHAPFNIDEEQNNCLWQRERKEKTGDRETIRVVKNNHSLQSAGLLRRDITGSARISDVYSVRKFGKPYDLSMVQDTIIHSGINYSRNKNLELFKESIAPAGPIGSTSSAPQNIITVGVGTGNGIIHSRRCEDESQKKRKYIANVKIGNKYGTEYYHDLKSDYVLPLNLISGTVHSGYNKIVKSFFSSDIIFSNLHNDIVGNNNDIGMQGPFSQAHVGGKAYRHIDINRYDSLKSVNYTASIAGTYPAGTIEFDISVLETKRLAGTSSWVEVKDADGTTVRATYDSVYDLFDSQWTTMNELEFILKNKLDVTTNQVSDSVLDITQSSTGSSYNYTIQVANAFITASGFTGGTSLTYTTATRNLDGPGNRPEGWGIQFKDHTSIGDVDGAFGFIGPDYGSPYPYPSYPKAHLYREETTKRPVNIKNIKTTSSSPVAGNYKHGLELFQINSPSQKSWAKRAYDDPNIQIIPSQTANTLPDTTNYQTLISVSTGSFGNVFLSASNRLVDDSDPAVYSNVIEIPRTDLTGSDKNIVTRFSAPGGPEVSSIGYLDAYSQTFSVHNAMPFRNLSILNNSGETGSIRVEDHLGLRRGLKTLLTLHQGQFGIDADYGAIESNNYSYSGSFNKQHRNKSYRMEYSGSTLITGSVYDNAFINSPIPRSEFQYSWIHAATYGDDKPTQHILGYAPEDGEISSSAGWVEAIVFPSASTIYAN